MTDPSRFVLLWNLKCDSAVVLSPGLTLRPLTSPLTVFDLANVGAEGFREWSTLDVLSSGCMSEIESTESTAVTPGFDALNRVWLAATLLVLRGCGKVLAVAVSEYSWNLVAGISKRGAGDRALLPRFQGGLLDYRLRFLLCASVSRASLAQEDAEWLRGNFEQFNRLASSSEKFRFALEAASDWRYAHDARAAIARIWAGIEALFGISAELVYRISVTAASLLKPRGSVRIAYAAEIKRLYSMRSKAVHGEKLEEEKLSQALDQSFVLLRDLLLKIAERGSAFDDSHLQEAIMG